MSNKRTKQLRKAFEAKLVSMHLTKDNVNKSFFRNVKRPYSRHRINKQLELIKWKNNHQI